MLVLCFFLNLCASTRVTQINHNIEHVFTIPFTVWKSSCQGIHVDRPFTQTLHGKHIYSRRRWLQDKVLRHYKKIGLGVAWPSVFRLNKIHKLVCHTQSIEVLSHYLQQSKNLLLTSEWQTLQDIVFPCSNELDVFLLHESYMVCI